MTTAIIQEFEGATLDQYDRIIDKMGITPGGKHPEPGCLFHWVAQTDSGLTIDFSVLSGEDLDALGRIAEKLGSAGSPWDP